MSGAARTAAADRIVDFLRRIHPVKTAENVAADSGLHVDTIQKWIDRGSAPSLVGILTLTGAYGPDVLVAAYGERSPMWLTRIAKAERAARIEAQIELLRREQESLAVE